MGSRWASPLAPPRPLDLGFRARFSSFGFCSMPRESGTQPSDLEFRVQECAVKPRGPDEPNTGTSIITYIIISFFCWGGSIIISIMGPETLF